MAGRSPYYFDKAKADAAVDFFPRFLRFVDGEWAGRAFTLSRWEETVTREVFGWRRRADGTRRYRAVRVWIPRKNGKTSFAAGLAHLMTIADGEPGAQVYSHALDIKQASICYEIAARMVVPDSPLFPMYEVTKTGMLCPAMMSNFRPLSSEAYGKHGLSPHGIIGDEAHAWKNSKLHTFLLQGMAARRQPLDWIISTAGEIKTTGHDFYQQSKAIFEDSSLDPETYVSIYEASDDDDWTSPDVWRKANPNLGISLKLEFLRAQCRKAMKSPRAENDFKRYHLNLWVEQERRWFPMRQWRDNTARPGDADYWRRLPDLMSGRKCFAGIDLGATDDLSAKVSVFPPDGSSDRFTIVPRFWMPEDNIDDRDKPAHPYRRWAASGAIETTPGNVTDYDFIEAAAIEDAKRFNLQKLAIDRLFQGMQVAVHLQGHGLPVELFGQGFYSMAAPSKEIERLFLSGKLEHGNHPVLEWMFRNATYSKDSAGNIKPDKARAADKIDGVVATVMALGMINTPAEREPEYQIMVF